MTRVREWKPGDVAIACYDGEVKVYLRVKHYASGFEQWISDQHTTSIKFDMADWHRPLVVIDPDDMLAVERLQDLYLAADAQGLSGLSMKAALDEFADPKPRIEEPAGLGAVVEADLQWDDGKGFGPAKWASSEDGSWVCLTDGHVGVRAPWPALQVSRVLSEGVTV